MNKLTQEQWIEECIRVHNNKYDYSKVHYVKSTEKVCIICPVHGEFWQLANDHKRGFGCKLCNKERLKNENINKDTRDSFINKAIQVHGNFYDYSKVNYIDSQSKVTIICPIHGEFQQRPYSHLAGHGCSKCYHQGRMLSNEDFIQYAMDIHGSIYDYSKVQYNGWNYPVTIICPKHGEFLQTPNVHLNGRSGCPICRQSKGEQYIDKILTKLNLDYKRQYTIKDSIFKQSLLRIDFCVFYHNMQYYIEYNGIQHFEPVLLFGGEDQLKKQLERDNLLRQYCQLHNNTIKLLEFSYNQTNEEIEDILYQCFCQSET